MARIISFSVEGLAGRDKTYSKTLQNDVNVFFGINGCGKTTLLKILHSALSTDASILEGLPFKSAEVEIYLNRHKTNFKRRIQQQSPSDPAALAEHVFTRSILAKLAATSARSPLSSPLSWSSVPKEPHGSSLTPYASGYLPITRLYRAVGTQTSGVRAMSDQELDARFAAGIKNRWTEYQSEVSTNVTEVQGEGLANILHLVLAGPEEPTAVDTDVEISNAYERVAAFLSRQEGFEDVLDSREVFERKYRDKPEIKSVVKQIDIVERKIEKIHAPRQRFQHLLESMYSGQKRIVLENEDITVEVADKSKIRLPALSSGEKQLFFIALEALRAGNHSLIIDEPELSMHVDWQKILVASLRDLNPRMQLIMATHSPEIMADLADEKVFRL